MLHLVLHGEVLETDGAIVLLCASRAPGFGGELRELLFCEALRHLSDLVTQFKQLLIGHIVRVGVLAAALFYGPLEGSVLFVIGIGH
jgi:hypothetical protein